MDERIRQGAYRKTIEDFTGGLNLFLDPAKIKDNEFTIFDNLVLSEKGKLLNATKRKSIERYITNRTASTNPVRSVFETIWKTRAINNRILVRTSTSIEYTEGAGFTSIASGLSDAKMRAVTFKDSVYLTDGVLTNKFYDGTNYLDLGTPPALQSFTANVSTENKVNLGTGTYCYLIAFLYDGSQESSVVLYQDYPNRNYVTIVGTQVEVLTLIPARVDNSTGKKINLSSIPTGNARVTARVIYRTKSDGKVFYYHSTISDNTTTVLLKDDLADEELGEEYNGGDGFKNIEKPYRSKYLAVHQRRLWLASLNEDKFSAIDISGITASHTASFNGNISTNATRATKYKYKFSRDARIIKGKELDANFQLNPPYPAGIFGVQSTAKSVTTDPADTEITLENIPIDSFYKRTTIFRNCCQFISNITGTTTLTVTVGAANVFKEGESVTISGVSGFTSNPNGTYVIFNVTSTTFQITHTVTGGSYSAATGTVEGSNYYICGFTSSGTFDDGYSDAYMVSHHTSITTSAGNQSYKSSVTCSDIDTPDIFPPGNVINLGQDDNEEITGLFAGKRRLIVFKTTSAYEIDTTFEDVTFARARKVIYDIGAVSDSIIQTSDDRFLFLGNDNYFYFWDGYSDPVKISDTIQSDIDSLSYTNIDAVYYPKFKWAVWTYSVSGTEGNVLIYDTSLGKWYHFKKNGTDLNLGSPVATRGGALIFGNRSAGYLMKYGTNNQDSLWESGTTFTNTQIRIKIQSKLWHDEINIKKIFTKVRSSGAGSAFELYYGINSETPVTLALSSGLNIIEKPVNIFGRESYYRYENAENIALSFLEMGHEYLPIHQASAV